MQISLKQFWESFRWFMSALFPTKALYIAPPHMKTSIYFYTTPALRCGVLAQWASASN